MNMRGFSVGIIFFLDHKGYGIGLLKARRPFVRYATSLYLEG